MEGFFLFLAVMYIYSVIHDEYYLRRIRETSKIVEDDWDDDPEREPPPLSADTIAKIRAAIGPPNRGD
jgi:hypothetical protein